MKLTTHLQIVPTSRKRGSIHPLRHTPSWHSSNLVIHREKFTFFLTMFSAVNHSQLSHHSKQWNLSSAKGNISWSSTSTSPFIFMAWTQLRFLWRIRSVTKMPRYRGQEFAGFRNKTNTIRLCMVCVWPQMTLIEWYSWE
jgi:hypothetical protein